MARRHEWAPWRQPSPRLILIASAVALISLAVNLLRKLATRSGSLQLSSVLESLGLSLFMLAYAALWVLLVIGPFRPFTAFSLRGFKRQRVLNLLFALAALVLIHLLLAFAVATAGS